MADLGKLFKNKGQGKSVSGSAKDMEKALKQREEMEKAMQARKEGKRSKATSFIGRLFKD